MSSPEQTQIPEVVDQAVDTHEKESKTPKESFAELRKAKEDSDRKAWQSEQELKWYKDQQTQALQRQAQASQQPQEEDYDFRQLEQEEFPDGKKLVKAFSTMNKKMSDYERKLAAKDQKLQILETAQEFADFKEVVTAENIEKYIKSDEDHVEAMQTAANPLRKAYNLIKKDSRYQSDKAAIASKDKPISQEQRRVEDKQGKPVTGSLGVRSEAVSTAAHISNSRMTKEQKTTLWKETLAAARK